MMVGVATIALPILAIVSQFVTLYPKNVELKSQEESCVGGAVAGSLIDDLKPIRKPSRRISRTVVKLTSQ